LAAVRDYGSAASFRFLPYVPFENPTFFETRQLARRRHIFHNVVPLLPFPLLRI